MEKGKIACWEVENSGQQMELAIYRGGVEREWTVCVCMCVCMCVCVCVCV